jgi:uncharacterized membrane protein
MQIKGDRMKYSAVVAHIAVPLLGFSTGLRSFTPIAVTAWFARMGKLRLPAGWTWVGSPAAVGLFTAGAIGEYVGDKLPKTPNRTSAVGLIGRLAFGGLVGGLLAAAFRRPIAGGVALGALGSAAGTYGGFYARRGLTEGAGLRDLPVALFEDSLAVMLAVRSLKRLTA